MRKGGAVNGTSDFAQSSRALLLLAKHRRNRYNEMKRLFLLHAEPGESYRHGRSHTMDEHEPAIMRQTTVALPFLDDEVPALYLEDGRPYIPVFAVCHALGIPPASSIRRWRNLALWVTARKLPFQTKKQGRRLVWCLLISQVPFLYSLFDWKLVAPERQAQLRQATEAQVQLSHRAYQDMQQRYKATRQLLFQFMSECADIERFFQRNMEVASKQLDGQAFLTVQSLIERGRELYRDAAAHGRKMLQEQGELPIIDAVRVDAANTVVETFSMPLLPIVPEEDITRFLEYRRQLTAWYVELAAVWHSAHKRTDHESQG